MSYAKFSDAFKAASDLLKKPYPGENKVELKGSVANGPSYTAEAVLGAASDKVAAVTTKAEGFTFGGAAVSQFKVDKVEVNTKGALNADFSLSEAVKGTKLSFKAADASRSKDKDGNPGKVSGVLGAENKGQAGTFTVDVDVLNREFSLSALSGHKASGVLFGASVVASPEDRVKEFKVSLGLKKDSYVVGVTSTGDKADKSRLVEAFYHQKVNSASELAAVVRVPAGSKAGKPLELAAGFSHRYAPDTTIAGKVEATSDNAKRDISFSYAQQISPIAKITVGAGLDGKDLGGRHSMNVLLSLSA